MEISERYHLEKRLGAQHKRKFGELFLATDTQSGEKVVLKVVRLNKDNSFLSDRLYAEASFSFDFDGLPKTLHFEETEATLFLSRAYIEGITLDEYWKTIKRKQRMPFVLEFLNQLVPIFNHLKQHEIVHCDLKPSNFLIEPKDDSFQVHLLDFGLALRRSEKEKNAERKLIFPLGYAAPELLLNQLDLVDQRTDLFSLGIILWRLYAGNLPLSHPNPSVFTNLQLTHPLPEHSELSKKLHAILLKMTFKHPFKLPPNRMNQTEVKELLLAAMNERFQSLEEVVQVFNSLETKKRWWQLTRTNRGDNLR